MTGPASEYDQRAWGQGYATGSADRAATEAKLSAALATIDNLRTGLAEQTRLAVAWKAVAVELRKKLEERL